MEKRTGSCITVSTENGGLKCSFDRKHLKTPRVILISICTATFIMIMYSTLTHYWVESTLYYEHRGLWKHCNQTHCMDFDDPYVQATFKARKQLATEWLINGTTPVWLYACRTFIITGCVTSFTGIVVSSAGLFSRRIHGYYSGYVSALTFLCMLIPVYVYSDKTDYFLENLSCAKSWGIGFLTVVTSFLAAFMGFCTF